MFGSGNSGGMRLCVYVYVYVVDGVDRNYVPLVLVVAVTFRMVCTLFSIKCTREFSMSEGGVRAQGILHISCSGIITFKHWNLPSANKHLPHSRLYHRIWKRTDVNKVISYHAQRYAIGTKLRVRNNTRDVFGNRKYITNNSAFY